MLTLFRGLLGRKSAGSDAVPGDGKKHSAAVDGHVGALVKRLVHGEVSHPKAGETGKLLLR